MTTPTDPTTLRVYDLGRCSWTRDGFRCNDPAIKHQFLCPVLHEHSVLCHPFQPAPTPAPLTPPATEPVAALVERLLEDLLDEAHLTGLDLARRLDAIVAAARAEVDVEALVRFLTSHCGSRCTVDEHWRLFREWQAARAEVDEARYIPGYRVTFAEFDRACQYLRDVGGWSGLVPFDEAIKAMAEPDADDR